VRFFKGRSLVVGTEKENVCLNNGAGELFLRQILASCQI
jgi:hypothetical protein